MDTPGAIRLVVLIGLLLLSAFFSSGETALTTMTSIKINSLIENGNKRAVILKKVKDNNGKMLSAILIGNNVVNLSASALTTTMAIDMFGNYAVGFATGLLTLLILIFGEIVPKNLATYKAESIALAYAPVIYFLMIILTPVIFFVELFSNGILKLFHIDVSKKEEITEKELRTYVNASHTNGVIESEEKDMIINLFDFSDSVAKDVMIPRVDVVSVDEDCSYDELMATFQECMFTRIPIYKGDSNNIIGLVNIKDFILVNDRKNFHVSDIIRDAYYTYEYKGTADLLMEMRKTTNNVAFVISEYGACVGMITLEDLLEEIVGEIRDEYDEDEEEVIKQVGENIYSIEGSAKLCDVNDELNISLQSEDYDSIAGVILQSLDRMPVVGEEVTTDGGMTLKVEVMEHNRIKRVLLTIPEKKDEDENLENIEENSSTEEGNMV